MTFEYKILNHIPVSGTAPEYHYGETSSNSLWIEFEDSEFNKWIGSFTKGINKNEKILKLNDSEFFILANGTAYLIDCVTKENLFPNEYDFLEDIIVIESEPDTQFLISEFGHLKIINRKNQVVKGIHTDHIENVRFFKKFDNYVTGEFESYWTEWETNKFELNLETEEFRIIK